ncbi:mCG145558, partial [Mus musculus]
WRRTWSTLNTRQEHTQDNRNLLQQSFYCLPIRREDPEPGKWHCLYSPQHDISAPDVALQLLIRCSPITPLLHREMGSD